MSQKKVDEMEISAFVVKYLLDELKGASLEVVSRVMEKISMELFEKLTISSVSNADQLPLPEFAVDNDDEARRKFRERFGY